MAYAARSTLQAWQEQDLGAPATLGYSFVPMEWLVLAPGFLGISGQVMSKLLLLGTVFCSALSMRWLASDLLARGPSRPESHARSGSCAAPFAAWCAGVFYGFSPLLFGELIGGGHTLFVSYAVSPLIFLGFHRAVRTVGWARARWALFSGLALTTASAALNYWALDIALLAAFVAASRPTREAVHAFGMMLFFFAGSSLYWTLPVITTVRAEITAIATAPSNLDLANLRSGVPSPFDALLATGFFRPFFVWAMPPLIHAVWTPIVAAAAIVCLGTLLLESRLNHRQDVLVWPVCLLLFILFATGLRSPLSSLVAWAYEHVAAFSLFRSPQRWMMPVTLCYSICLGFAARYWLARAFEHSKRAGYAGLAIALGIVLLWINPFLSGDLGRSRLRAYGGGNFVSQFRWSPATTAWARMLEADPSNVRALFLPMALSPYYLATPYQDEGQGGDPLVFDSPKPTLTVDASQGSAQRLAQAIAWRAYLGEDAPTFERLLALIGVKYVALRNDVRPNFGPGVEAWNYPRTKRFLDRQTDLHRVRLGDGSDSTLRAYETANRLPHIYATTNLVLVDQDFNVLVSALKDVDLRSQPALVTYDPAQDQLLRSIRWDQMFLSPRLATQLFGRLPGQNAVGTVLQMDGVRYRFEGWDNTRDIPGNAEVPVLHFALDGAPPLPQLQEPRVHQVGTTRYDFELSSSSAPMVIVLGEASHPGWQALMPGPTSGVSPKKIRVNGYANGWMLIPDGTAQITEIAVSIRFSNQAIMEKAGLLSVLFVSSSLLAALLMAVKARRARSR
ncbi:MAG: hypothetical protein ACYDAG_05970 [Chloroflexota bacterium]